MVKAETFFIFSVKLNLNTPPEGERPSAMQSILFACEGILFLFILCVILTFYFLIPKF